MIKELTMKSEMPYMQLVMKATKRGYDQGCLDTRQDIAEFIEHTYPSLQWLAKAILHGDPE
jgi:hypothetical protein